MEKRSRVSLVTGVKLLKYIPCPWTPNVDLQYRWHDFWACCLHSRLNFGFASFSYSNKNCAPPFIVYKCDYLPCIVYNVLTYTKLFKIRLLSKIQRRRFKKMKQQHFFKWMYHGNHIDVVNTFIFLGIVLSRGEPLYAPWAQNHENSECSCKR